MNPNNITSDTHKRWSAILVLYFCLTSMCIYGQAPFSSWNNNLVAGGYEYYNVSYWNAVFANGEFNSQLAMLKSEYGLDVSARFHYNADDPTWVPTDYVFIIDWIKDTVTGYYSAVAYADGPSGRVSMNAGSSWTLLLMDPYLITLENGKAELRVSWAIYNSKSETYYDWHRTSIGYIYKDQPGKLFDKNGNQIDSKTGKIIKTKAQIDKEKAEAAARAAAAAAGVGDEASYGGATYRGYGYGFYGISGGYGYITSTTYTVLDRYGNTVGTATYYSDGTGVVLPRYTREGETGLTASQIEKIIDRALAEG